MDKEQLEQRKIAEDRIQEMLNNLEEATRVATTDVSGWDKNTMNGALIRKREAEDQIAVLKSGYRATIENSFVKVFLTGDRAAEFAKSADAKGFVVIDGSALYTEMAKHVEPSMDHKERQFTATQIALMIQILQRYMQMHRLHVMNQPKLDANDMGITRPDTASVVEVVRKSIRATNNDDLLAFDLADRALDKALEKRAAKVSVPVIITGLLPDEAQSLQTRLFVGRPSVSIEATSNTTDEDLFKQIEAVAK